MKLNAIALLIPPAVLFFSPSLRTAYADWTVVAANARVAPGAEHRCVVTTEGKPWSIEAPRVSVTDDDQIPVAPPSGQFVRPWPVQTGELVTLWTVMADHATGEVWFYSYGMVWSAPPARFADPAPPAVGTSAHTFIDDAASRLLAGEEVLIGPTSAVGWPLDGRCVSVRLGGLLPLPQAERLDGILNPDPFTHAATLTIRFTDCSAGSQQVRPGDFNRDGLVSVQDIFDFLADWFSRGGAVSEVFEFVGAWIAG